MSESGKRQRRLSDGYSFAGFRACESVRGVFGDPDVRIVTLDRRSKKRFAAAAVASRWAGTIAGYGGFRIALELEMRRIECGACASVKRERLEFLADNPHFTKRFAFYVGRRCRQAAKIGRAH